MLLLLRVTPDDTLERVEPTELETGSGRARRDAHRHLVGERCHGGLPPRGIALQAAHHGGLEARRGPPVRRRLAPRPWRPPAAVLATRPRRCAPVGGGAG